MKVHLQPLRGLCPSALARLTCTERPSSPALLEGKPLPLQPMGLIPNRMPELNPQGTVISAFLLLLTPEM